MSAFCTDKQLRDDRSAGCVCLAEQMCNMSCATKLVQHVFWPAPDMQADLLAFSVQCVHV